MHQAADDSCFRSFFLFYKYAWMHIKLPVSCHSCDEELWTIGVGTSICHWQKPCTQESSDFCSHQHYDRWQPSIPFRERKKGKKKLGARGGGKELYYLSTWASMLQLEILISKLLSVNWFSTSSITKCEITSLNHETGYNPMKFATLEMERFSTLSNALLPWNYMENKKETKNITKIYLYT